MFADCIYESRFLHEYYKQVAFHQDSSENSLYNDVSLASILSVIPI
jgi:hypothetical protein